MDTPPDDPALLRWAESRPREVTGDPLWKLAAYRHAAYIAWLARDDAQTVAADVVCKAVAGQLLTSATSVAANIAESYGRPTNTDRLRFLSYALGSVREALMWYEAAASALGAEAVADRLARLSRARRILLGLINRVRGRRSHPIDGW
ncbi:MAG TPA: four helix bundle protein [Gemmatimonadaceae bacterium]|nr:four helix bundle protein [Gemmatimonadaceae bacterium]